jgi:hypothetical protein
MPLFNLYAYLRVFKEWSALLDPGFTQAIITIFPDPSLRKESLKTIVNLEALKGT